MATEEVVPGVALSKLIRTLVVVTATSPSALVEIGPSNRKETRQRDMEIVRAIASSLSEPLRWLRNYPGGKNGGFSHVFRNGHDLRKDVL
jgi:hypothetical protein